jgi:HlyD family secretion protein
MNRRWIIVIGALGLLAAIGLLVWTQINNANAARPQFADSDVTVARRGTLIATVSATGAIEPRTLTSLSFLGNGNLAKIFVKRGDKVNAGQTLAQLDTASLDLQLQQAEANLAATEAALAKLKIGPSDTARASAEANLASAQAAYDALQKPAASSVASAQANVNSALAQYNRVLKPDATEMAIAKADVDKALAALNQAQAAYDRIGGASNPFIAQTAQALQLQTATLDYQKALNAYTGKFNPTDALLKAALAQVQQAKDALARLQPTQENLAQAQAQIKQAQDTLAHLTATPEDLAQAEAQVAASRAARDLAKQRLSEALLIAPVQGTIITLDLAQGEFVQAGHPVITIADLDKLEIKLSIDETDIPRVQLGQPVLLDLDAFPGQQVQGVVREIAPAATTLQGVVNYDVRIDVTSNDVPIKAGMTANANVQVARQENVLLVPTRSIRAQGSKRLVTILENGQLKEVTITLGLSNEQETEILSGLDEGAQVLTIAVPSNQPAFGGGTNRQGN